MARAARVVIFDVLARRRRRSTEFVHISHQFLGVEYLFELGARGAQREDGSVAIHLRRNGGVKRVMDAQFSG